MSELQHVSLSFEQIGAIKRALTSERPYADRMSFGFALRLLMVRTDLREDQLVLDELDCLEGIRADSRTKTETQFKYPPLHPFWHKHFTAPRHLLRNISIRWALDGERQRDLDALIRDVQENHGSDPDSWPGVLVHRFVLDAYVDRARRGLTGDWIIFAKHEGANYYLDLATHEEADEPQRLYEKLRLGSAAEFPFLFSQGANAHA
jgi:hypothetical protein